MKNGNGNSWQVADAVWGIPVWWQIQTSRVSYFMKETANKCISQSADGLACGHFSFSNNSPCFCHCHLTDVLIRHPCFPVHHPSWLHSSPCKPSSSATIPHFLLFASLSRCHSLTGCKNYVWQNSSIPVIPSKSQGLSICWLTLHV